MSSHVSIDKFSILLQVTYPGPAPTKMAFMYPGTRMFALFPSVVVALSVLSNNLRTNIRQPEPGCPCQGFDKQHLYHPNSNQRVAGHDAK